MSFLVCLGSKSGQFWRLDLDPFCTYQMWSLFISGQIYLLLRGQNQEPFGYQICTHFLGPDTNLFWVPDLKPYLVIFVQFWAPDLDQFLATRNGNQNWAPIKIYKGTNSGPQKWSQNWHQKRSQNWHQKWSQIWHQKLEPKIDPKSGPKN